MLANMISKKKSKAFQKFQWAAIKEFVLVSMLIMKTVKVIEDT